MAFLAAALFAVELLFLPLAGIQADEVLFLTPFLKGVTPLYSWHAGSVRVPVMVMDYIGGLKTWLYWPLLHAWPPDTWSIRLPACLLSIATVIIFGDTVRRVAGVAAALFAVLCLATDAPFVLTNVYDWGPVTLLLLGMVLFLNLLRRFAESSGILYLGSAFLLAGVSVWYKAIFLFPFAAVLCALAVVYFKEFRARLSLRNVSGAVICFAAGLSPLIAFNIARPGATVAAANYIGVASVSEKTLMMRRTLDGRALEHYIFRSFPHEKIPIAGAPLPDLIKTWYRESRLGPGSALPVLLLFSLIARPFQKRLDVFRHLLFAWIATVGTFCLMLAFRDAGAGPHHTVLVYPGPQFIVAATLVAIGRQMPKSLRHALAAVGIVLVASNLYLLDRYYAEARQNGFSVYWTDGARELSRVIEAQSLPVAFLDWGIRDVARVETGDKIALAANEEPREGVLYVAHCGGYVIDEGQMDNFERKVVVSGLHRTEVRRVSDPHGEPVFCLSLLGP